LSRRTLGSIRWLSEGVARVEIQSGYDRVTGKPRRISKVVRGSEADAERALARLTLEIGKLPAGKSLTFGDYFRDLYKPRLEKSVRKSTRRGYVAKIEGHVLPRFDNVKLEDLEPYVLEDWLSDLSAKMSAQSALHVYRALNTSLNRAVKWKLLVANPLRAVDPPKVDERELDVLDAREALAYLEAFRGNELEALIVLSIATGFRPCELYGLEWKDVDLGEKEVRCERGRHQLDGEVYLEDPKSKRSRRVVSLPDYAVEALRPLRGFGLVTPLTPAQIVYRYRKHVREKELRYLPLRDLRHSHATLLLEAGVEIALVSRRLGHSTIAITDKHYLRPKRSADRKSADSFGELLALARGKSPNAGRSGKSAAVED